MKNRVTGFELLLKGDSQFDQEVWSNLAKDANQSRPEFTLGFYKDRIPQNIKTANKLLIQESEPHRLLELRGFFPSHKVDAFVEMTRYGLVRFYFMFIILNCLSKKSSIASTNEREYFYKCLFEYFNLESFSQNLTQLSNFGTFNNRNKLSVTECKKFNSYIDVCVSTVAKFLSDRLYFEQAMIEKLENLMISLLKFLNCEHTVSEDYFGMFHLFEIKLVNLMNANAICLANNIPVAVVGNAGETLTFSTNKFLEFYRRGMLKLFYGMTPIDQASLRVLIGNNSFLKLLNRFPISISN